MKKSKKVVRLRPALLAVFAVALMLLPLAAHGQQSPSSPQQPAISSKPIQSATPQATASSPGVAKASSLTPIHGIQGVLAETIDGRVLARQAADETFNPASSIKLATALVALETFGPDYRYTSTVWTKGHLDELTGTLNGDLIVSGRDPSFHSEHAVMLARELNLLGIRSVNGNLIVAPTFTLNFDWSARRSGLQLYDMLDSSRRPANATKAWIEERNSAGDAASLKIIPGVTIKGSLQVGPAPTDASLLFTHRSSRLVDILKVLLCYSNNFMAERIGDTLGGPEVVRHHLIDRLRLNPTDIKLASLSGLGINRVTPNAMMTIFRALRLELAKNKLSPSDIMPVAGIDPGTLKDRYTSPDQRGSIIAKTGTLISTDRGASSLVGQMQTRSGMLVLFVIFNQHGSVLRFRANQDEIVTSIQNTLGGPAPFAYRPGTLAMRLADTENETAKGKSEYEPKNN